MVACELAGWSCAKIGMTERYAATRLCCMSITQTLVTAWGLKIEWYTECSSMECPAHLLEVYVLESVNDGCDYSAVYGLGAMAAMPLAAPVLLLHRRRLSTAAMLATCMIK